MLERHIVVKPGDPFFTKDAAEIANDLSQLLGSKVAAEKEPYMSTVPASSADYKLNISGNAFSAALWPDSVCQRHGMRVYVLNVKAGIPNESGEIAYLTVETGNEWAIADAIGRALNIKGWHFNMKNGRLELARRLLDTDITSIARYLRQVLLEIDIKDLE